MPTWLIWAATTSAVVGAILNVMQRKVCFYLWTASNSVLLIHNVSIEEYAQASLWAVYLVISVAGIVAWTSKSEPE